MSMFENKFSIPETHQARNFIPWILWSLFKARDGIQSSTWPFFSYTKREGSEMSCYLLPLQSWGKLCPFRPPDMALVALRPHGSSHRNGSQPFLAVPHFSHLTGKLGRFTSTKCSRFTRWMRVIQSKYIILMCHNFPSKIRVRNPTFWSSVHLWTTRSRFELFFCLSTFLYYANQSNTGVPEWQRYTQKYAHKQEEIWEVWLSHKVLQIFSSGLLQFQSRVSILTLAHILSLSTSPWKTPRNRYM